MKILNDMNTDYHVHSCTFSDWLNTIEELVQYAKKIWLREIAITDHSSAMTKKLSENFWFYPNWARYNVVDWKNVHNDVEVIFWVEADLLNENWDICTDIQGFENDFIVLAAHSYTYQSDAKTVTDWLVKAIERHHTKIKFIAHPHDKFQAPEMDIEKLVKVANKYNIPLEFNWLTFKRESHNQIDWLNYILANANEIYINSDAHTLTDLENLKVEQYKYLSENGYI